MAAPLASSSFYGGNFASYDYDHYGLQQDSPAQHSFSSVHLSPPAESNVQASASRPSINFGSFATHSLRQAGASIVMPSSRQTGTIGMIGAGPPPEALRRQNDRDDKENRTFFGGSWDGPDGGQHSTFLVIASYETPSACYPSWKPSWSSVASSTSRTVSSWNSRMTEAQWNMKQESAADTYRSFHMIRGEKRIGLIVDPGASKALIGTHTLVQHMELGLNPRGLKVRTLPAKSGATFTGIDGVPSPGQGSALVPLGMRNAPPGLSFQADMIGGEGSCCPGLLPNEASAGTR